MSNFTRNLKEDSQKFIQHLGRHTLIHICNLECENLKFILILNARVILVEFFADMDNTDLGTLLCNALLLDSNTNSFGWCQTWVLSTTKLVKLGLKECTLCLHCEVAGQALLRDKLMECIVHLCWEMMGCYGMTQQAHCLGKDLFGYIYLTRLLFLLLLLVRAYLDWSCLIESFYCQCTDLQLQMTGVVLEKFPGSLCRNLEIFQLVCVIVQNQSPKVWCYQRSRPRWLFSHPMRLFNLTLQIGVAI